MLLGEGGPDRNWRGGTKPPIGSPSSKGPSIGGLFSIAHIRAGRLRALAVTGAARSEELPDVPTVGEFVPGYEASAWQGIGAPKGTPADIIDKLNQEINAGLADAKIKARLADLGAAPIKYRGPFLNRTHQGRAAACSGGDRCSALGGAAGRSYRGRICARLRGERMARHRGAKRHAGGHH